MIATEALRLAGNTIGLSVANTSHTAVTVQAADSSANGLYVCNTSTSEVMYVTVQSSTSAGLTAAGSSAIPGDGTAGAIPVLAYDTITISGLTFPVSVTAISSVAGPTLLTVTPVNVV